ncbi:MAG: YceI family protein [Mycobacterium sp.]
MTLQSLLSDPALAGAWTLEPEQSSVRFTSRTLWGLIPINGRFTEFSGEGRITPDGGLSGRLVIRADSVRTGIGMRDRHLRAADFFDAANHPDIVVDVTAAPSAGQLAATLTIRGTTLEAPLRASLERQGANSLQITARGEIDRTRWGVSGNMLGMMPPGTVLAVDAVFVR